MPEPILLTPGPTPVPKEVREALAKPLLHHRTKEFQALLEQVEIGLKELIGTKEEVLILTSSGTGAMEAAVANLLSPGDSALVIRGGKFGQRWAQICESFGIKVIPLDPVWGKPLDVGEFSTTFSQHPEVKAVFATLCETSTGVTYPIREIRQAMGGSAALLVVDAISGLLAEPFSMDSDGVDVTVVGSQKGLMLPPGLSFIALSKRAWEAVPKSRCPKYYFNLTKAREAWGQKDTPFTPGINLIVGLAKALEILKATPRNQIVTEHQAHSKAIRKAVTAMGLELYADQSCASGGITSIKVPPGISGKELLKRLREQEGIVLAGGQGKELEGKIFRIASMGAIGLNEIRRALEALERVLTEMGFKSPHPGAGIKALEAAHG